MRNKESSIYSLREVKTLITLINMIYPYNFNINSYLNKYSCLIALSLMLSIWHLLLLVCSMHPPLFSPDSLKLV